MAEIVLGIGASHGPLLSTPPEQWDLRAKADRENKSHWFRGKTYDFESLLKTRAPGFASEVTVDVRRERFAKCRQAMEVLGKNGVLVMVSITGGDRQLEVPADKINQGFVLGNKVAVGSVNASREDFERGVQDLSQAQLQYPGWLGKLLTHPVKGLESYDQLIKTLTEAKGAIKVYCEIAPL